MNKIILIGNLTRDPEFKNINDKYDICNFSIAVNRKFQKDKDKQDVDYFNITVFGKMAETCNKFLRTGRKVGITGSLQIDSYEAQDGSKRQAVRVIADEVEFLTPKQDSSNLESRSSKSYQEIDSQTSDNLPF